MRNMTSLIEMTKCRWKEFCREPSAFFFVVSMPLLWMLILGFAFSDLKIEQNIQQVRYVDFLIPGLLSLSLFTTSLFGTGMTIVANRREYLLKRYAVTPMNPYLYITSHIFGRYMIFAVEFLVVILGAIWFFDFEISGSWIDFTVMCILSVSAFTALSLLFSSRTQNSAAYNGMINLITLPTMLLSGVWFPQDSFPSWLAAISKYLPLTPVVDALRQIAVQGVSISALSFQILLVSCYLVLSAILAKKFFRWY